MRLFGFSNKLDKAIIPYMNLNSKRKIPVIVCSRSDSKVVRNKIISCGGKLKYEYPSINSFACEVSPMGIDRLSEIPEVSFICFDHKASLCLRKAHDILGINYAHIFKLSGKGIGIGLVDSGVFPHNDLISGKRCIRYFKDLVNGFESPYDDNGHGTFMCGCISSSGSLSDGMYSGIAPDADLCIVKAFDASGNGFMSDIIAAIDILISIYKEKNIRVICLPFEFPYINEIKVNPLSNIVNIALSNSIAVVAPSGNHGPQPYSVYCPGNIKDVITVGGTSCLDNNVKNCRVVGFSGRGPLIDGTVKPDIVSPCSNITSLSSDILYIPTSKKVPNLKTPYTTASGTSISCALISGICSLILEKTPTLTPKDLKSILCLSTMSIGENKFSQGSGFFIFDKIVK